MANYKKGTFGWFKEQAKKDGFDNIKDWQNWKREKLNEKIRKGKFDQSLWTKEKLIDLIRKTYNNKQKVPIRSDFDSNPKYPNTTTIRRLV